jgi:SPP1 gp7 family putative phage head morphogenesis protein
MQRTELYARGVAACDAVLCDVFGIDIRKALNPLNRKDFVVLSIRLAAAFERAAKPERVALDRAIKNLDRDWPRLTQKQRRRFIEQSSQIIRDSANAVMPGVIGVAEVESPRLTGETRKATRTRHNLNIAVATNAFDKRVIDFNVSSQGNYITHEFGQRSEVFSRQARQIVSGGLARGEGRDQIAGRLDKNLRANGIARSKNYWNVAAGVFVNRSRTFGQLSAFKDADIRRFIFEAMLDEVTSDVCRMMHGRFFSVDLGIQTFDKIEALPDPLDIRNVQPFARTRNVEGGQEIQISPPGGEPQRLATVVESAVGQRDKIGRFSNTLSDVELQAAGVTMPPLHGGCRSIVVPDI